MCKENNKCGCNNPCQSKPCGCTYTVNSDCVLWTGGAFCAIQAVRGDTLTKIIEWVDNYICELTEYVFLAENVGGGIGLYIGETLAGVQEFKTFVDSESITVTEDVDAQTVSFTVNEDWINDFIEANQKTYSVDNVGTGVEVYKDSTIVGDNTQFNFRTIVKEDLGSGQSFLRDIQQNTNELNIRVKTVVSNNLTITATDNEVRIETPMTASIPALYVNNLYIPTYAEWLSENALQNGGTPVLGFIFRGKGTLSQPFTDSTVYPLLGGSATITPNTAIQNALEGDSAYAIPYSYVGSATRLAPQRNGQQIIVQNNNNAYIFPGDFNYENINIKLSGTVIATTTGYLIDMDNASYFNAMNGRFLLTIDANHLLELPDCLGFRNSGNTSSTPPSYDSGRIGAIYGDGTLYSSYAGANILTRYIFTGEGNNNDDNLHFQVKCIVRADQQGIYFTKNKMRIDFHNRLNSGVLLGTGNVNLKAFHMTGGQIRFYEKGGLYFGNGVTGRTYGATFEPQDDGIGYTIFALNSGQMAGNAENCFVKLNNEPVSFLAFNSPSGDGFATTLVGTGTVTNGLFENLGVDRWNVDFKNNVFSYTGIDLTKVDLTGGNGYSAINFIGNEVLETLIVFPTKAAAVGAGHPINSAFIKRTVFDAVDLLAGIEYKVVTSGVPSLGAVGSFFTATGAETGTGTASLETREIIT